MIDFEKEFIRSSGKSFEADGVRYCLAYSIDIGKFSEIHVHVESMNSEWKQGIHLSCDKELKLDNGSEKEFVLWPRSASRAIQCSCQPQSTLNVWNVWEVDKVTHSWHNGAAMIVSELGEQHWRFQCNDGHPDNNCDDLVFTIELR